MVVKNQKRENRDNDYVNSGTTISKDLTLKQRRQLIWFFAIIGLVFLAFLGTYFYVQSLKNFDYLGIQWTVEDSGKIKLYHAKVPIVYKGQIKAMYNVYLRNDPRNNKLVVDKNVKLSFDPEVVISTRPNAAECTNAARLNGDLSGFLSAFPTIKNVSGAVHDKNLSKEWGIPYADCTMSENKTIIVIQKSVPGELSFGMSPVSDTDNCYILDIGECENTEAIEGLIIEMIRELDFKEVK